MFFSIIIPVYNSEKYIINTLKSIINQTYKSYEVILINDGSTDKSLQIIESFIENKENFTVINQENLGVSAARNKGLEYSKGEFICFLDADDFWESAFLEEAFNCINQTSSDVYICGVNTLDNVSGKRKKIKISNCLQREIDRIIDGTIWAATGTWVIRKKIIIKYNIKFDENRKWAEDQEFIVKAAIVSKVFINNKHLFTYRLHENSLSDYSMDKLKEVDVWKDILLFSKKFSSYQQQKKIRETITKYRIPMIFVRVGFESLKNDNLDTFLHYNRYFNSQVIIDNISKFPLKPLKGFLNIKIFIFRCILLNSLLKKIYTIVRRDFS